MTEVAEVRKEGRFYGLPYNLYRSCPGLSYSMIKDLRKSPQHLMAKLLHPDTPTYSQLIGIGTHEFLLESSDDPRLIVRPPQLSPYTDSGKKWKSDKIAEGRVVITEEDMENIHGMKNAIMNDPELAACITQSKKEVSCFAELEVLEHKVYCKARIDCVPDNSDSLLDIKTCSRADDIDKLAWNCLNYCYHLQCYHYLMVFNATRNQTEPPRENFVFAFVESERPWGVRKVMFNHEFLALANKQWQESLLLYISCISKGEFPCYDRGITVIKPPKLSSDRYLQETL